MNTSDLSVDVPGGFLTGSSSELPSSAARYFVDLGWGWDEARLWLEDTASLAAFRSGGTSAAAAKLSGASASDAMVQQVYRELEQLERQARGKVLTEVTARLVRRAATLGSAGLELIAPSAPQSREALVQLMEWESGRSKSERLLSQLRSGRSEAVADDAPETAPAHDSPSGIALGLSHLARRLTMDDHAWVGILEVTLAFGDAEAARDLLLRQLDDMPPVEDGETNAEAGMRERSMRLLALAHFLLGEDERALGLMGAIPLVLDRSASMGTLRAAAEFRLRQRSGESATSRRTHDEFVAPVGANERRNVARFLSLAHRHSAGAPGDLPGDPNLGGSQ